MIVDMEEAKTRLTETFSEAKTFGESGDVVKSLASYTSVIDGCVLFIQKHSTEQTTDAEVCNLLAQAYNNRGYQRYLQVDFHGASDDYTKCLATDKTMYVSFYNRGLIHYRLGRYGKAIDDLREALRLQPDFEPAQKCLEQSLIDQTRTRTSA